MIIIPHETVFQNSERHYFANKIQLPLEFIVMDDGDAFTSTQLVHENNKKGKLVNGLLKFTLESELVDVEQLLLDTEVVVIAKLLTTENQTKYSSNNLEIKGWVKTSNGIESYTVQLVPLEEEIFSRIRGLYETEVLNNKTVLFVGLGSGGSFEVMELVKAGVGNFILVDHDRIEVVNVIRHTCGLSDLGRFKTKAIRDRILDKNPFAKVETYEQKCTEEWLPTLKELVKRADLVFCSTDNRDSRVLVNRACVLENRVCIYGGTFERAYGGTVLRVIPHQTMCYQCFIDILPDVAENYEISSQEQADAIAYADRPVAVEPGLATDIASIALMSAKLGILELLRGTETTLATLYEDLSSSWFQWLNRRELGTQYADLQPLDSGDDGLRILAWYGIDNEKNPACPVCGDFLGKYRQIGISTEFTPEQLAAFGTDE